MSGHAFPFNIASFHGEIWIPIQYIVSWAIPVHKPNGIFISSAIFAQPGHVLPPKNCLFARGSGPPFNKCFLGPIWVHNPNSILIGSAVLAQFMWECHRAYRGMPFLLKIVPSQGGSVPHLTHGSLGPPDWAFQTSSRSVQPHLHSSWQKVPILHNGHPFPPKLPYLMHDSLAHPSPQLKWHLDQFSRFCSVHRTVSPYFTVGCPIPSKLPQAPSHGGSRPHGCFGPPKSSTQMASQSVQPFLQGSLVTTVIDKPTDQPTDSPTVNQQHQSTEGKSKYWTQQGKIIHCLILTRDGKA